MMSSNEQPHTPSFAPLQGAALNVNEAPEVVQNSEQTSTSPPRRGRGFSDFGMALQYAKTVNDLLKAVYDVLEMHRTIASRREVLNRDMNIFNILMYPQRSPTYRRAKEMDNMPLLIDAVLAGRSSDPDTPSTPRGLMIDFDHSALLGHAKANPRIHDAIRRELKHRIGTPTYIARAVTIATFPCKLEHLYYLRMPTLDGKAKELYTQAYGQMRYDQYTDDLEGPTRHGGLPRRDKLKDLQKIAKTMPVFHRWEYDAESVFWTMYAALLRAQPRNAEEVPDVVVSLNLKTVWGRLKAHTIPDAPGELASYNDSRQHLLGFDEDQFAAAFHPTMRDVAILLQRIAEQVSPTYALMDPPPPFEDHLHEAMQRLILEYLVDHEQSPIPLVPGVLRSVEIDLKNDSRGLGTHESPLQDLTVEANTGSKRPREENDSFTRRVLPKREARSPSRRRCPHSQRVVPG
ncbi:hypothetical protein C8Q70DRAFT_1107452 [Cubamyces menziesii]|nr:hypothetical protein C8Q70DRAFT_1107452 [Cubamyces menziesii]